MLSRESIWFHLNYRSKQMFTHNHAKTVSLSAWMHVSRHVTSVFVLRGTRTGVKRELRPEGKHWWSEAHIPERTLITRSVTVPCCTVLHVRSLAVTVHSCAVLCCHFYHQICCILLFCHGTVMSCPVLPCPVLIPTLLSVLCCTALSISLLCPNILRISTLL